jgi:hypothetical protein
MSQRTSKAARTAEAAVDRLEKLYAEATAGLSSALDRYLSTGEPPSAATRATFRYPLLRVVHRDLDRPAPTHRRAFGRLQRPRVYETTVTPPCLRPLSARAAQPSAHQRGSVLQRNLDFSQRRDRYIGRHQRIEDAVLSRGFSSIYSVSRVNAPLPGVFRTR